MNDLVAALLVILATGLSVHLITYLHRAESRRPFTRPQLLVVTGWFLLSYGLMAFVVIPH